MSPYFYSLGVIVNDEMIDQGYTIYDRLWIIFGLGNEENR